MARAQLSAKQLAINKDNGVMLAAVGLASFLLVFSLVSAKALISQQSYQSKVIAKKKIALKQINTNKAQIEKLKVSYESFVSQPQNILEGNPTGTGPLDGDSPRIILDALPSKYDFPALTTSIQKILRDQGFALKSIEGTDDEVSQSKEQNTSSPAAVEMPVAFSSEITLDSAQKLLQTLERSIRPMQVQKLNLTGTGPDKVVLSVELKSYYQPEKKFEIKTENVK